MSKKKPDNHAKPISGSQESSDNQIPPDQKSDHQGMTSGNHHTPERMETFPKTNTFPKNWDLSSFSKKQK